MNRVQDRVQTHKRTVKSTANKSLEVTRHQFGRHIWMHVQLLGPEKAIDELTRGKEQMPKNVERVVETHEAFIEQDFIHTEKPIIHIDGTFPVDGEQFYQAERQMQRLGTDFLFNQQNEVIQHG